MTPVAALALTLLATGPRKPDNAVCNPVTASCLASLSMEPWGPELEVHDSRYLDIVGRGLAVVPELTALLADDTLTSQDVPLFGGKWAVGDIAMSALSDIVAPVRWLELVPGDTREAEARCGFCVYWDYVRASKSNRAALCERFRAWYALHAADLIWVPNRALLTGGSYAFRKRTPRR